MKKIFILGVSRTGSKFYMQLLNSHKDIFISPELMFIHPYKKDFYTLLSESIASNETIEVIVDKLFDFKERLPYTKTIQKIGRSRLTDMLNQLNVLSPMAVFDCIVRLSALAEEKVIYGAKFPIHFTYSEELMRYFVDSNVLYLTRDPRAIFISDQRKKKKESKGNFYRFPINGIFIRLAVLFYTIKEWKGSLDMYEKCVGDFGNKRIKLFKYEDIIYSEKTVLENISSFLDFPSSSFDLKSVEIVDSSFSNGVSSERWKSEIRFHERLLFQLLIGKKMKKYGY
jgi:hypothetical protein